MGKYGEMKKAKDWLGLEVETICELRNGHIVLPANSKCKVFYVGGGVHLEGPPCQHCGVKVLFMKVPYGVVKTVSKD